MRFRHRSLTTESPNSPAFSEERMQATRLVRLFLLFLTAAAFEADLSAFSPLAELVEDPDEKVDQDEFDGIKKDNMYVQTVLFSHPDSH
jgi:hypothetical protein